jgi:arylsulfatase A-like enzyme
VRIWPTIACLLAACAFTSACASAPPATRSNRPNVVIIYADDLGYGDVSSYGATRIRTPTIDRLAAEGLRFTRAHATSATCTPSRYGMLTGEYPWRKPGTGVARGDAALLIEPGRTTLASIMQRAGYSTGVVGKWHLGLGPASGPDWNGVIEPGPMEIGFGYSFLMPATGDRVPTVYVRNDRVVGLDRQDPISVSFQGPIGTVPTGRDRPDLLRMLPSHGHDQTIVNGISRIGYMTGGKAALWKDEEMADVFTTEAVSFIEKNRDRPFFLFFSTHDIHVPRAPHPRFAGKSGMGPRGDAILEFDWSVGEIVRTLRRLRLDDNTLVIVSSDNGPVVDDGYRDEAVEKLNGHRPAGPLRGGKYSAFEGGTRVPFVVRWTGTVRPGTSDALFSQVDLPATFAALAGVELATPDAPDSYNMLPALLGKSATGRDHLIEHAGTIALVRGDWKYIQPGKGQKVNVNTNTELGNDPAPQLYNLKADPSEARNVATEYPDRVRELSALLEKVRKDGRSRPSASVTQTGQH